jgi:hypothetical protein
VLISVGLVVCGSVYSEVLLTGVSCSVLMSVGLVVYGSVYSEVLLTGVSCSVLISVGLVVCVWQRVLRGAVPGAGHVRGARGRVREVRRGEG